MFKKTVYEKFVNGELTLSSLKDIMRTLNLSGSFDKKELEKALFELEEEGKLLRDSSKRYAMPEKLGAIKGKLKGNERGFAFLIPSDGKTSDFFIPHNALGGAMHGDTVFAVKKNISDGNSDEAYVVKIIERGYKNIVGTFVSEKNFGFVRPDDKNYYNDIFVPFKFSSNAKTGDKVVVKIKKYPEDTKQNPEGEITEVLGRQFTKDAEEKSIIKTFNLPEEFSKKALDEAQKQASLPVSADGRIDLRDEFIITIDGEDAKDLDDAVSIKRVNDGYELSVHIADVSHYVKPGSALDKEAFSRATSVYFPDMVIPMLPEKISNGICSLSEAEDKLALSCIMTVNQNGDVTERKICESIIKTRHRMTYNKVFAIINNYSEAVSEYKDAAKHIYNMHELAKVLIAKRERRGSIDLDMKEAAISTDRNGVVQVSELKRTIAHRIIEEFMILANETVAEYIYYLEMPFIYRVHEKPSEEKLFDFTAFIKELGVKVKWKEESVHSKDFQNVLSSFAGTPLFALVNKVMLRAMSKAKYHPVNIGHFGLSSDCYCHFTSPIRRYPDLFIHRVIKAVLNGQGPHAEEKLREIVFEAARQSSEKERNADEAERAMDDLYKVRYMSDRVGEEYDAIVSGVQSFGVFAELENTIEGLIKLDTLPKGRYDYDEKRYTLKSKSLTLKLGDPIRIKVVSANEVSRKIEFVLIEKKENAVKN